MKRILIIGSCGAGKSTLSRKMSSKLNLPIIHLDQEYWQPGWEETPKSEWEDKVKKLIKRPTYIMDGNYASTLDIRLSEADHLIFLDYPTRISFWRVLKRIISNYGKTRSDMTEGCPERFDIEFLHYVLVFNLISRKRITKILEKHQDQTDIVILKTDKEVNTYLAQL